MSWFGGFKYSGGKKYLIPLKKAGDYIKAPVLPQGRDCGGVR